MAEPISPRRRRRRLRRRRAAVLGAAAVVVLAAGGTAWAMSGSGSPGYRLATVTHADIQQTVDADGSLSAKDTSTIAFPVAGTVASVSVKVGDTVRAGQTVATLDPTALTAAVTSATNTVAQAKQTLADDEQAQADGTTSTGSADDSSENGSDASTSTGGSAFLDAAITAMPVTGGSHPTGSTGSSKSAGSSGSAADVRTAQRAVISAQQALDKAVAAQDSAVKALLSACAATTESGPITAPATASSAGTVAGAAGSSPVMVSLADANGDVAATTSPNPQSVAAGGTYSFGGLTAGNAYTVRFVRTAAVDSADCTAAITTVGTDQRDVDSATKALDAALSKLTAAVGTLPTGGSTTTGSGSHGPSTAPTGSTAASGKSGRSRTGSSAGTGGGSNSAGSGRTSNTSGSSGSIGRTGASNGSGSAGHLVTAEQIAADTQAIDAARAALAVAELDAASATLTTPISGTVATVDLAAGDSVSAGSSSETITVVGTGVLSVDVDIDLADIDLVKVGQHAAVTVDGRTRSLPGTVNVVGVSNSSGSTGSAASYTVTVGLDATSTKLYDGMGASVAIDVGTAARALSIPISAVHSIGTLHTVSVYSGGKVALARVGVGVVGAERVQITSGLSSGQRVVLADLGASVPSPDTSSFGRARSSLTGGLSGGGGAVRVPGGGFGGGRGGR